MTSLSSGLRNGTITSLSPYIPLFTMRGKPMSMDYHYQLMPLFTLNRPPNMVFRCARQLGKSYSIVESGILLSGNIPDFNTLYIQPRYDQISRLHTTIMKPLINRMVNRGQWISNQQANAFLMKTWKNNSITYMEYMLMSSDRLRGISGIGATYFDECQDLNIDFIPIAQETMSASIDYGFSCFTGTSKTTDGTLEVMFERSSQAYWTIKCSCGKYNSANPDEQLFKMIGLKGLTCAFCGKMLNTHTGVYQHAYKDRRAIFPGYHISQVTHPIHCTIPAKWNQLLAKVNGGYDKVRLYNEVLGIPCDESLKLLTATDVRNANNGISADVEKAASLKNWYDMRILGIDWSGGGGLGKSFTAGAVCGARPGQESIDCTFGFRIPLGIRPEDEVKMILYYFDKFKCHYLAHDYTGAGYLREVLLTNAGLSPEKIIPYSYVCAPKKPIVYVHAPADGSRSSYNIDKPRSLALMSALVRHRKITLPNEKPAPEAPVLTDLIALTEAPTELIRGGTVYLIGKAADRSDDFAHALNFASNTIWYMRGHYPQVAELQRYTMSADDAKILDPVNLRR